MAASHQNIAEESRRCKLSRDREAIKDQRCSDEIARQDSGPFGFMTGSAPLDVACGRPGVSFENRQDLLGHKSGRMTTHYPAAELHNLIEAAPTGSADKSPVMVVVHAAQQNP